MGLLDEIELRKALTQYFEDQGTLFAATIYEAISRFGFRAEIIVEIVSVVCRDPDFALPDIYLTAIETIRDTTLLGLMNVQVGKFITEYFLERFWPKAQEA